jgi:predicted transcriptional regulator
MGTQQKVLNQEKLVTALKRLELVLEPDSQKLIEELQAGGSVHLPQLSQQLQRSPYQIKKQLEQLKAAGFVFSPKRFPKAYSVNVIKCLKIVINARSLSAAQR